MKRRGSRAAIISVLLLGLLIFGIVYFAWTTITDVFQPVSASQTTIPFVVKSGETGSQVADALQAKGLIRNALAFRIWARIKGQQNSFQAGVYYFSQNMTIDQIIALLQHAQVPEVAVTIQEGLRLQQIAFAFAHNATLNQKPVKLAQYSEQDFLNYTLHPNQFPDFASYPILKSIPAGDSMEGLLFPDTFLVPVNATARDVINLMLNEFNDKVQQNQLDVLAKNNQLSVYQMVILASIVEREARFEVDRPLVASVYWNRIYKPNSETVSLLDADPTVQYARDSSPGTTTYWIPLNNGGRLIAPTSPWNTYTHTGFPPTPICSPGLASLEAAASPTPTSYYFFLTKPADGHNVYAKTNAEFQADEQKYLGH